MKKIVASFLLLTLLAIATPVTAGNNEPVGEQINIAYGFPTTFPAGAPFHIMHGWGGFAPQNEHRHLALGIFDFELEVDGVFLKEDFVMTSGDVDVLLVQKLWIYNFPHGMTGTHTFTGHWFAPCQLLVDLGEYSGPCSTPNARIEAITQTLTVTFVP